MMLTMATWDKIRERFSEDEKATLNAAICGETICPRGCIVDEEKLGPELVQRLKDAKAGAA